MRRKLRNWIYIGLLAATLPIIGCGSNESKQNETFSMYNIKQDRQSKTGRINARVLGVYRTPENTYMRAGILGIQDKNGKEMDKSRYKTSVAIYLVKDPNNPPMASNIIPRAYDGITNGSTVRVEGVPLERLLTDSETFSINTTTNNFKAK